MLEDGETGAMLKLESSGSIIDARYLGLQIDSHYPLTSCNSAPTPKMDNETKQVSSLLTF